MRLLVTWELGRLFRYGALAALGLAFFVTPAPRATGQTGTSLSFSKEIELGRRAAEYGRFAQAEAHFLKVDREARSGAPDAARMARFHLALLYKSCKRLADAKQVCLREIAASGSRNARDLAPFRIALAGIYLREECLQDAEWEICAAQSQLKNLYSGNSSQSREVLHLKALLEFLRYKMALSASLETKNLGDEAKRLSVEKIADGVNSAWQELRSLQAPCGDVMGTARTYLYLSQLDFLRWQGRARRAAAAEIRRYEKDLEEYRERRDQHEAAVEKYNRDCKEQRASGETLKARCEELNKDLVALRNLAGDLRSRRAEVVSGYDAVWSDMLPGAAKERMPQELEDARKYVNSATALLENSPIYPTLRYVTLCHRAAVLRACAGWGNVPDAEIERCLKDAVAVLETMRLSLSEADEARAEFFFQYTQAFDPLIEWYRLHDQPREALIYAELCRNRTLLDWICSNGGEDQQKVREQLQDGAEKIAGLTRQLQDMAPEAKESRTKLLTELNAVSDGLNKKLQEVTNTTRAARAGFGKALTHGEVDRIIKACIKRNDLVLYYHVGAANTYLFVLGLGSGPRLYRLGTKDVYDHAMSTTSQAKDWVAQQNVTAKKIAGWVEEYVELFKNQGRFPGAGPSKKRVLGKHTKVLLPEALRRDLAAAMKATSKPLLISTDGALQQLPFEALWVSEEDSFFIDLLPPNGIAYTPSLVILDSQEQAESSHFRASLVTAARSRFAVEHLDSLTLSTSESKAIVAAFSYAPNCALADAQATKARFFKAVAEIQPACLHLATHCVNSDFTSKLLLYPDCDATGEHQDGSLTTGEICSSLRLDNCRLAVLSACRTNIGSEVRGEMSMSIARAFLAAHAHRVVASQWPVDDNAACEFATTLLSKVAADWKAGDPCNYAAAMIAARQTLRLRPDRRGDPFYWAPFVLIGPAHDMTERSRNSAEHQRLWQRGLEFGETP
jgi:CHAT domain-containing protein